MLTEFAELEAPPIEFDEKLWHAVVDAVRGVGGCSYFGVERCMKSWYNRCYTITANKVEKVPSGFAIILA